MNIEEVEEPKKYENLQTKPVLDPFKSTAEHRKVRELPRKMNISSWAGCCSAKKRQKSTSFIFKIPFKSIAEHRKVRELPRKMNIEEVEEPKKYENLQTKPVLDPFKSTAEHRKVRELPRKMNIEEVEEPETTKIYRQKPFTPDAATPKLRKFTDETNMQARNHENSDEFRAGPVRHLDLDTRAFYYYRKNPKCYHTVWGKKTHPFSPQPFFPQTQTHKTQRISPKIVPPYQNPFFPVSFRISRSRPPSLFQDHPNLHLPLLPAHQACRLSKAPYDVRKSHGAKGHQLDPMVV